ncbi:hypothetical protein BH23ACI1_BH23ACI1_03030 [soil metagenome]
MTILFCFAHPDDESFSGAGTAMRCAAAGAKTVLVTATLGERGKRGDPPVCEEADLPAVREHELRNAAAVIGFDELHLLGYRDRELADAPPEAMRRVLVSHLRRLRPAVVVTFDPNGFNAHPDHVAISRFCSEAIAAAADPRWHPDAGAPHQVRRLLWTPPVAPWDAVALDLAAQPGADFVIDVSAFRKRRIAALRAHRTQHLSVDRYFFDRPELDRIVDVEIWRQAWGPALATRPSRDVFDGL